ncbi:MAG: hypothetical protein H6644_23095 [Caldilineaceae bacterium]|nr:hypothetical protein [Caldilineaceae bacterium]MCB9162705.1 hypothetical protein [Caldilineaceae bacterium]
MSVPKRFAVLRFFGSLLKVLAWILLVLAIVAAVGAAIAGSSAIPFLQESLGENAALVSAGGGIISGLVALFIGLFYFVAFYAMGEYIHLALAVEENTRLTAALLLRMHQESQPEQTPSYTGGFTTEPFDG